MAHKDNIIISVWQTDRLRPRKPFIPTVIETLRFLRRGMMVRYRPCALTVLEPEPFTPETGWMAAGLLPDTPPPHHPARNRLQEQHMITASRLHTESRSDAVERRHEKVMREQAEQERLRAEKTARLREMRMSQQSELDARPKLMAQKFMAKRRAAAR